MDIKKKVDIYMIADESLDDEYFPEEGEQVILYSNYDTSKDLITYHMAKDNGVGLPLNRNKDFHVYVGWCGESYGNSVRALGLRKVLKFEKVDIPAEDIAYSTFDLTVESEFDGEFVFRCYKFSLSEDLSGEEDDD